MRLRRTTLIGVVAAVLLTIGVGVSAEAGAAPVPVQPREMASPPHQVPVPYGIEPNLIFNKSNKCIDVPNSSTGNVALIQYTCNAQSNQHWELDPVTDLLARIRNVHSGKCMNVEHNSLRDNAHIIQYPCGNYDNEVFAFYAGGDVPAGYYLIVAYSSGKALNVYKDSVGNNATIRQYTACNCTNEFIR